MAVSFPQTVFKGSDLLFPSQIQDVTGARVNFRDEADAVTGDRVVTIRGTHESAQQAELLVRKAVAEQPTKSTETIYVPGNTLGRIIGE